METVALETEGLTKRFSGLTAVDGICWELNDGEVKGLLGPNGAGKSTFFNMIAGVLTPTSGSIYFKGQDITGESAHEVARHGIGIAFQTTNLFDDLTVLENLRTAAQVEVTTFDIVSDVGGLEAVNRRADEILDRLNLEAFRDTVVDELSHGEKRKVEIGVVMATDPDVILFDEPTAGVSANEMDELKQLFSQLAADEDQTMVLIEHNVSFLLDLVDVVTVLHEGEILAEGSPGQITENEDVQRVYLE